MLFKSSGWRGWDGDRQATCVGLEFGLIMDFYCGCFLWHSSLINLKFKFSPEASFGAFIVKKWIVHV